MELVPGKTLEETLGPRPGAQGLSAVVSIGRQIAEALERRTRRASSIAI
jgi:hypothetical protein